MKKENNNNNDRGKCIRLPVICYGPDWGPFILVWKLALVAWIGRCKSRITWHSDYSVFKFKFIHLQVYLNDFAKTCPLGFCLDLGANLVTLNPEGALSRPGWAHGPGTDLSVGGLLVAGCQKQGGGEDVLYWHSQLARLWVVSVK